MKILAENYKSVGMSIIIAKDALSIYVNINNPINNISLEEIKKIFKCEIKSWSDLGGIEKDIIPKV